MLGFGMHCNTLSWSHVRRAATTLFATVFDLHRATDHSGDVVGVEQEKPSGRTPRPAIEPLLPA